MIVYGNSVTCVACRLLKDYLDERNIGYEYRDLSTEDNLTRIGYKKELKAFGIASIPLAIFAEGRSVVGFDNIVAALENGLG